MKPSKSEKKKWHAKEFQNKKDLTMHPESLVQGRSLEWAAEEWLTPGNPQKNISFP